MQKTTNTQSTGEKNHIRIGFNTRVGNVIRYVTELLNTDKPRSLHFSAIGGAIGSLVNVVEVLRTTTPGLYQVNKISSVSHKQEGDNTNERLSPKLDVTLTLDKPTEQGEGFQTLLKEEERLALLALLNKRLQMRTENRERGGGQSRGGRGFSRGGDRGFQSRGFSSRGGDRGFQSRGGRGFSRGGDRGFSRGGRGGFEGQSSRGGFVQRGRGGFEGQSRGGRGFSNDQGFSRGGRGFQQRGGFEGQSRGGNRGFQQRGGY
jgi:hypothetical protein